MTSRHILYNLFKWEITLFCGRKFIFQDLGTNHLTMPLYPVSTPDTEAPKVTKTMHVHDALFPHNFLSGRTF